jgi:hypothetical protein
MMVNKPRLLANLGRGPGTLGTGGSPLPFSWALLVFVLFAPALSADSYLPFADHRVTDGLGGYYAVLTWEEGLQPGSSSGYLRLIIARGKAGSLPVQAARAKVNSPETRTPREIAVREGDTVCGQVKLDKPPGSTLVSSTGLGVVLLDVYGGNWTVASGKDPAVTLVSRQGEILHTIPLGSLFKVGFHRTGGGSLMWLKCAWIDEEKREVVVVGRKDREEDTEPVSVVDFSTGRVRPGGTEQVLQAITTKNPAALSYALDLAMAWKLQEARPHLSLILQNRDLPLEARLRAAVFLASFGDKTGADLVAETAVTASKELLLHRGWQDLENERLSDIDNYAVEHLSDLLGEKALPILCEVALRRGYPHVTWEAFVRLGSKSVPDLVKMLNNEGHPDGQVFAADVLGEIKPDTEAVLSALTKALKNPAENSHGWPLRRMAAFALGAIGPAAKKALPVLAELVNDEDERVREEAVRAIRQINP